MLEGTRSGLRALGHLLAGHAGPRRSSPRRVDRARRRPLAGAARPPDVDPLALLADYGVPVVPTLAAGDADEAVARRPRSSATRSS